MKARVLLAVGIMLVSGRVTFAQVPEEMSPQEVPALPPAASPQELPALPAAAPAEGPIVPGFLENTAAAPGNERFWATGEYLFSWFRGDRPMSLVTTSPAGTAATSAGVPGQPGTTALFGGSLLNTDLRSGGRITMGYWLTPNRLLGVEGGFMIVGSQSTPFAATSDGTTILARPFTNAITNTPQSQLIAFPGKSSGAIAITPSSGTFYSANFDFAEQLIDMGGFRLTSLLGYRFFRYDEGLGIQQSTAPRGGTFVAGTQVASQDSFRTENQFNGLDLGLRTQYFWESFSVGLLTKLAVGHLDREVKINGSQQVSVPGAAPLTETGGLYALTSNIGTHNNNLYTVLPEVGLTCNWQATNYLRLNAGYSIIWLEQIARAADQIDPAVNPNLLPPATQAPVSGDHPAFFLHQSNAWLQSLSVGVTFTY